MSAARKTTLVRRRRRQPRRTLYAALAASVGLHLVLMTLIAAGVGGNGAAVAMAPVAALRATLVPAATTALPEPVAAEAAPVPPPSPAAAALPTPASPTLVRATEMGRATINFVDDSEPADAQQAALLRLLHPNARRAPLDFVAPPTGIYPAAAIEGRLQLNVRVLVLVHEDGRLELPQGSFEDPIFAPAIRASLAAARAQPAVVNGQARQSWALLSFSFEFVGGR